MADNKFGFNIHKDRQYNLDIADRNLYKRIALIETSIQRCIFCGGCASTCTASKYTEMSFRLISLNLRRGHLEEVENLAKKCMLCGKCSMVCPRDVNIRHVIVLLKKEFSER
jgi:heterodisulfide reductase subunit C